MGYVTLIRAKLLSWENDISEVGLSSVIVVDRLNAAHVRSTVGLTTNLVSQVNMEIRKMNNVESVALGLGKSILQISGLLGPPSGEVEDRSGRSRTSLLDLVVADVLSVGSVGINEL